MTFSQDSQKNFQKIFLTFILGIFLGWMLVFGFFYQSFLHWKDDKMEENTSFSQNNSQLFNNQKVKKVYRLLEENFYGFEGKTSKELEDGMIAAMMNSVGDKYSEYLNAEESEQLQSELSGHFYGIGAVVDDHEMGAKIARIIDDAPAQKAGLQVGDIVYAVDGKNIDGMKASDAVKLIRGQEWTEVKLSLYREAEKMEIRVTRGEVNIPSVDGKILEDTTIGYIQVNTFWEQTPTEFHKYLTELTTSGATGIVVDLRFNGGGYLDSAQTILSEFLPKNTPIVLTKENDVRKNETLYTNFFMIPNTKIPLVVLVNELSASASEIVAGAIQDYERGIVVGTKTYGKGSVQQMFDLNDGSMVKITTAKWYTPKDRNIDLEGIVPDIVSDFTAEDYKNVFDRQLDTAKKVIEMQVAGENRGEIIKKFQNKSE